jgi:hypothetical protein
VLALAMLLAVALAGVSGVVATRIDASRAPAPSEEELHLGFDQSALSSRRQVRLRSAPRAPSLALLRPVAAVRPARALCLSPVEGHRLANGLLAPLTC